MQKTNKQKLIQTKPHFVIAHTFQLWPRNAILENCLEVFTILLPISTTEYQHLFLAQSRHCKES